MKEEVKRKKISMEKYLGNSRNAVSYEKYKKQKIWHKNKKRSSK